MLPNIFGLSEKIYFKFRLDIFMKQEEKSKKFVKNLGKKPKFNVWGMSTMYELPWSDGIDNKTFLSAAKDLKLLEFTKMGGIDINRVDQLLWRNWIISFLIRYLIEFKEEKEINLVECGVANGISAFFALRELQDKESNGLIDHFHMHLYDSGFLPRNTVR